MSHSPRSDQASLEAELHVPVPDPLAVGDGTAIVVAGHARHPDRPIKRIEVGLNGHFTPALAHARSVPGWAPEHDAWWALVPILPPGARHGAWHQAPLVLAATLGGGARATVDLTTIGLTQAQGEPEALPASVRTSADEPAVAVCMATWNPPADLLRRQIESIRNQTYGNFACFIADDASSPEAFAAINEITAGDDRFVVRSFLERVGFYRNFERALSLVPRDADLVALADQDDFWAPDKLETLVGAFEPETTLVYSDMRIVDEEGTLISPTFWSHRPTNHTDLRKLMIANTITGAASIFRRDLLDVALPFPHRFGDLFHDHWLAVVALATGKVAYVDRPLYDYVQHGEAAQGHTQANLGALPADRVRHRWLRRANAVAAARRVPPHYTHVYLPARLLATVLDLRLGSDATRGVRAHAWGQSSRVASDPRSVVEAFAHSPGRLAPWLAGTSLKRGARSSPTLGRERDFLTGMAWEAATRRRGRMGLGTLAGDAEWS